MTKPKLIIFGGLPGTGKTTLARALSEQLNATHVRIDAIEQELTPENMPIGNEGYLIGYALAQKHLRAGNTVVADSVNPLQITRDAWRDVATRNDCSFFEIEIICSNQVEHKRRVETRVADISGHIMPTWQEIIDREYMNWDTKNLTIDTSIYSIEEATKILIKALKHGS